MLEQWRGAAMGWSAVGCLERKRCLENRGWGGGQGGGWKGWKFFSDMLGMRRRI